jgi:hypothetical protein
MSAQDSVTGPVGKRHAAAHARLEHRHVDDHVRVSREHLAHYEALYRRHEVEHAELADRHTSEHEKAMAGAMGRRAMVGARHAAEHNIYILESDGYRAERFKTFYAGEYGVLTFVEDHGLMQHCEAKGHGDAGHRRGRRGIAGDRRSTEGGHGHGDPPEQRDRTGVDGQGAGTIDDAQRLPRPHRRGDQERPQSQA